MQGVGMARKRKREEDLPIAGPTAERLAHAAGAFEVGGDTRGGNKLITMRDSPIERASARGVISQRQYTAAMKFRLHWYRAGLLAPLSSLDLDRVFAGDGTGHSGMARTDIQYFHRQRYREAGQYLIEKLGAIHLAVIEAIVCDEQPFENVGTKLQWKSTTKGAAAVTQMLRDGLDELVRLWGV